MANSVQFGIKNVYYAVDTSTSSTASWATPVALNGAVSLTLNQVGDTTKFYADNVVYYASQANQGYEGTLTIANIPESMYKDVFGLTLDSTDKTLKEKTTDTIKHFALGFQIDGDQNNNLYWIYNCVAQRPPISSETIGEAKTPSTTDLSLSATPLADGSVLIRSTGETTTTVISAWFSAVVQ